MAATAMRRRRQARARGVSPAGTSPSADPLFCAGGASGAGGWRSPAPFPPCNPLACPSTFIPRYLRAAFGKGNAINHTFLPEYE